MPEGNAHSAFRISVGTQANPPLGVMQAVTEYLLPAAYSDLAYPSHREWPVILTPGHPIKACRSVALYLSVLAPQGMALRHSHI